MQPEPAGFIPYTGPGMSPVQLYLQGEKAALNKIIDDLKDAAAEAQRRINFLETKHGIGSKVDRAQMQLIKRELHAVQQQLWRAVGKTVRGGGSKVAQAAATGLAQLEQVLFRSIGSDVPEALLAAQEAYAEATVDTYLARGQNGIGLSQRVYKTQQLSKGLVDRAINREILLGRSWQELAKAVRPMIDPAVKGGVSYAAKRLARTELNNAFHRTQLNLDEANPWVTGTQWHLSRSHPRPDICDQYANGHSEGKPRGVYETRDCPAKAHPQCLCYTTSETVSEDDFIESLARTTIKEVSAMYGKAARSA
jgi:hypothetical protein